MAGFVAILRFMSRINFIVVNQEITTPPKAFGTASTFITYRLTKNNNKTPYKQPQASSR